MLLLLVSCSSCEFLDRAATPVLSRPVHRWRGRDVRSFTAPVAPKEPTPARRISTLWRRRPRVAMIVRGARRSPRARTCPVRATAYRIGRSHRSTYAGRVSSRTCANGDLCFGAREPEDRRTSGNGPGANPRSVIPLTYADGVRPVPYTDRVHPRCTADAPAGKARRPPPRDQPVPATRGILPFAMSASVSTTNAFSRAWTRAFRSSRESPRNTGTLHCRTMAPVS